MKFKVFISSNQNEFKKERETIVNKIKEDFTLNNFFEIYLFETSPASGKSPTNTYKNKVLDSDIYIGLIGSDYGTILNSGLSPTETEYNLFYSKSNEIYIFIKEVYNRDDFTNNFIKKIKENHKYQTFSNEYELIEEIKRSLITFLDKNITKNNISFDERLIKKFKIKDINKIEYEKFFNEINDESWNKLKNNRNIEDILELINAGIKKEDTFYLNNAGALFFTDVSKYNIPHEIKMVRFNSNTRKDIIDRKVSKSPLLTLLEEVKIFFKRNTKQGHIIRGFNRITIPEYPFEVIRESIVNAIAHRDYELSSTQITFYIYNDRIEIISPGKLVPPVNLSNLGEVNPTHRNENICKIFSHTTYMEHLGTGIKRMKEIMKNEGLKEPEFEEIGDLFKVTLWGRDYNSLNLDKLNNYNIEHLDELGINERQIKVLNLMENENKLFTIKTYMKMFNISRLTALRDLNKLVELELVKKEKKGKFNCYYIK